MDYFCLTTPQKNIWNLQKYYGDTAIGNQCGAIFYKEKRDIKLLREAIRIFIQNQSGMRLRFVDKEEPLQYVSGEIEEIQTKLFSSMDEFEKYAQKFAKEPIGLNDRAMYKFVVFQVKDRSGVLVALSHLISDAWTFGIMANQVDAAYRNLAGEKDCELTDGDYAEYIKADNDYLHSDRYAKDKAFWEGKYAGRPEKGVIRLTSGKSDNIEAKRISKHLSDDVENKIDKYCKEYSVTPAVLFETALVLYLSHINPDNNFITIGIPVLNRNNVKEKRIAGMFVSTMPLTVEIKKNMTVSELAQQISKEHMNIFRHQKYPYSDILTSLREKQNFSGNLYDVMISYQNARTDTTAETKWYSNGYSEVPFTIHIDNRDDNMSHTINVDYQTAIFKDEREVKYIIERLEYILCQITDGGDNDIKNIKILPHAEAHETVEKFNDTYVEYPREKCVHELFTEQAKRTPDKIALVAGNKKYTYREIDKKSDALAQKLINSGVEKQNVVGAYLDRTANTVISQLAVLKAGGVFLPIDHRYPKDRINYMLNDCSVKLVICDKDLNSEWNVQYLNLNNYDFNDILQVKVISNREDACYIIYTSGSTGNPKGCVLKHKGLANFCANNNIIPYAKTLQHQTVVSVNTISFDFFIAETLLPLSHGWTVVFASEEESNNRELFKTLVEGNNVNIIETTPTRLELYTKEETGKDSYFQQIQLVVSAGETLSEVLLQKIRHISRAKVYNPLGPSECSVWNVGGDFKNDITIGSPIANTQIYILDKSGSPLPIGVPGELCIAGDGVGGGYLNRPELTAEKFVPNPFATEENHHGKIMYHTGDLACWRADGEIEYLGRIDTQVKIRGLRIELGEIENVMSGFPGIRLTAVSDKRDENNRQYLVGYYTSEQEIDEKELRSHLSSKLPKYMVPNYFMRLDDMPMTASGKTDRKNLPVPDFTTQEREYVAPETDTEQKLCELLKSLLHMNKVGIEDDFFEYGGDSLTAIKYVAKADDMGIEFSLQNVFDYPTVRELCNFLNGTLKSEKVQYEKSELDKYNEILSRNIVDESAQFHKKSLGNILITGATGFLGAHVVDELMKEEQGKIYCLVRGKNDNAGRDRLKSVLEYYFGDKYESEIDRRIIPVCGDIEEPLPDGLPSDVQTVIHTAASVKHYGSYSYFQRVNAEGTGHVVEYAKRIGAKLIHISTLSVSGNSMADDFTVYHSEKEKFFDETSFYIGQPLDNVYIHSKFEAERKVYDAMLEGLDAIVIRAGNLTNRASDYKFQPNFRENAFLTRVKAVLEFGLFPDYLMSLYSEFSPIDKTAEGIVKIAQYADNQSVFHLNSNKVIYFERFLDIVHELGISMKVVNKKEFNEALKSTVKQRNTEYIYEAFQNDMDEKGCLVYDSNIRIENDFTLWFLKKAGFEWNETDIDYIRGYIDYFRSIGYLEV